jgi:hypothetical protein
MQHGREKHIRIMGRGSLLVAVLSVQDKKDDFFARSVMRYRADAILKNGGGSEGERDGE